MLVGATAVGLNLMLIKKTDRKPVFPGQSNWKLAYKAFEGGCLNSPGDLPLSNQLEKLQEVENSNNFFVEYGNATGQTKIAARHAAVAKAKSKFKMAKLKSEAPSFIQTSFSCYKEKANGFEYFVVLSAPK